MKPPRPWGTWVSTAILLLAANLWLLSWASPMDLHLGRTSVTTGRGMLSVIGDTSSSHRSDWAVGGISYATFGPAYTASIPLLYLVAASALLPGVLPLRRWLLRRQRASGRCERCGYDLRASPHRCPECGMPR